MNRLLDKRMLVGGALGLLVGAFVAPASQPEAGIAIIGGLVVGLAIGGALCLAKARRN